MLLTTAYDLKFTQGEVDFVIPRLDRDLPLRIDPFLLFKSRSEELRGLHARLISVFDYAISLYESGRHRDLGELIDFPEAREIGLGYSKTGHRGSGLGEDLNRLFIEILAASEPLRERRLRHIEELQLLAVGIGPDRVSDIVGNALKSYLIDYTEQQCGLWDIPVSKSVPIEHILDLGDYTWTDDYIDLPRNPISGEPILLVPRRIVRELPWINYGDYYETEFKRTFLRPTAGRSPARRGQKSARIPNPGKPQVVAVTRQEIAALDRYVKRKEHNAGGAVPSQTTNPRLGLESPLLADDLCAKLKVLSPGTAAAADYQKLVLEIINYVFEPDLSGGEMEVKTIDGTERRDIIYTNESEHTFMGYLRTRYNTILMMFETKNVGALEIEHINQTSTYLGERLGTFGVVVTRNQTPDNVLRKCFSVYNDSPSGSKKVVLAINDEDLCAMLQSRDASGTIGPTRYVQQKYREFIQRCQ